MRVSGLASIVFAAWLSAGLSAAMAEELPPPPTASSAPSSSSKQPFWVEQLADGLSAPWGMAWLPNGDLLIVEKFGGLRIFHHGKLEPTVIEGPPGTYKAGVNGLLDIALDPDYARNHRVFISFTEGNATAAHGAIYRARFDGKALVDGKVIFRTRPDGKVAPHPVIGPLLFLPDKTLLFGSGAGDQMRDHAQFLNEDWGKILRLDRDGNPPKDNPFIGKPNVLPEIYASGVRSPLSLIRDPRTGLLWENENGPKGGDELNQLKPGANYGWPLATYGTTYADEQISAFHELPGMESPVVYWVPSIAPSAMIIYYGDRYPQWNGDFLITAMRSQQVRRVRLQDGKPVEQEVLMTDLNERFRNIQVGPDGYIYILTDNTAGRLLRLHPGEPTAAQLASVAPPRVGVRDSASPTLHGVVKLPAGDSAHGKMLFEQLCTGCHSADPGVKDTMGPNLHDAFARIPGTLAGYSYSDAMRAFKQPWDEGVLNYFLADPPSLVPGTAMTAAPVSNIQDRADIIAYLKKEAGNTDPPHR